MIPTKAFEIRQGNRFVPLLVIDARNLTEEEKYLFKKSGFLISKHNNFLFLRIKENHLSTRDYLREIDPIFFGIAIDYIIDTFDTLKSSQVIDVDYIVGKTTRPVEPYRYTHA